MTGCKIIATIMFGIICCLSFVMAETHVQGTVFGVWTVQGSPYIVDGSIAVPHDKTLTIRPRVGVYFTGNDSLSVYGGLYVEGEVEDSVFFRADVENITGWKGIFFKPGAWDNSKIEYASIRDAFIGISVSNSSAQVRNSLIRAESRGLVLLYANGEYCNNYICTSFLTSTGVYMRKSNAKLLSNIINVTGTNFVYYCFGIDANRCHYAEIKENIIRVQGLGGTFGILFDNCDHLEVIYNVVEAFSDYVSYGIFMVDSHQPVVRNNTVVTIAASIDKGIYCVNTPVFLTNNIIVGDGGSVGLFCQNIFPENSYNDLWNHSTIYEGCYAGEGDISSDPLFVSVDPYYYHLREESPCINTGNPLFQDPDGTRSDMGAYYYHITSTPPSPDITIPDHHWLGSNYPNPFNPETTIPFALSHRSVVTLDIYNVLGQHILSLWEGELEAGEHELKWSAEDMSSGLYFYRLDAGGEQFYRKMILQK